MRFKNLLISTGHGLFERVNLQTSKNDDDDDDFVRRKYARVTSVLLINI